MTNDQSTQGDEWQNTTVPEQISQVDWQVMLSQVLLGSLLRMHAAVRLHSSSCLQVLSRCERYVVLQVCVLGSSPAHSKEAPL